MSKKPTINGKSHISEKRTPSSVKSRFRRRDQLDLPDEILNDLEEKELEAKWLDAKRMADYGNFHPEHWELYKTSPDRVGGAEAIFGGNSGFIRRGTAVLGVRPKAIGDDLRAEINEKIRLMTGKTKRDARDMQIMAKDGGVDARIDEGYDDE